jgi:triphosphatase
MMTTSANQLARTIFTELHRAIVEWEADAAAGDVEAIHAMRVAIRRLRVALSNFAVCLPRDDRRRLRGQLERLADRLGSVRDLDVMIAVLDARMRGQPLDEQQALAAWRQRLTLRRRQRMSELMAYLRGEEFAAFKRESFLEAGAEDELRVYGQAA